MLGEVSGTQDELRSFDAKISDMAAIPPFSAMEMDELRLIYPAMSNRNLLNAFRELRTQLFRNRGRQNFTCMVTSLCEGGGASHVARNIAASITLDKSKTALLVDGNIYYPSVETLMRGESDYGLTDYLVDSSLEEKDVIYATGVPRLRTIPVGSHCEGGAEHFSSTRMAHFVESVKRRYDDRYVIIDAPSLTHAVEAKILADLCDVCVVVVPYGMVTQEQIKAGVEALGKEKVAGVVFNN